MWVYRYLLKILHGRRAQIYKCPTVKDILHSLNTHSTNLYTTTLFYLYENRQNKGRLLPQRWTIATSRSPNWSSSRPASPPGPRSLLPVSPSLSVKSCPLVNQRWKRWVERAKVKQGRFRLDIRNNCLTAGLRKCYSTLLGRNYEVFSIGGL